MTGDFSLMHGGGVFTMSEGRQVVAVLWRRPEPWISNSEKHADVSPVLEVVAFSKRQNPPSRGLSVQEGPTPVADVLAERAELAG